MNKSIWALLTLAAILGGNTLAANAQAGKGNDAAGSPPPADVPTFSTENIARQGHFYVGGKWEGEPGKQTMTDAMYVEVWVPKKIRHPYPILFSQGGGGQTNIALLMTPDGRPGWAYDFVNQGYTVYMMDLPARGRSAYNPAADGNVIPPRTGELMEEVWSGGSVSPNPLRRWPQQSKYTQWPSNSPNKGKIGDPVFDYFAKTEIQFPTNPILEKVSADDIDQLIDMIHTPVILLVHSAAATSGFLAADGRPGKIKAILAPEPWGPPIMNAELDARGPARIWGMTNFPVHYDPPIKDASELKPIKEAKADGPGLVPCYVQTEPAHKLINLESVPVLNVAGEASYHRPYAHCVARWLNQAGVKTQFVGLETVGLPGNDHQMMSEKNSAGISKFFMEWLDKNVH
jgi:pimeloyl-ACP methyl ester carboxylesterase